jgi:hypothetical protein
LSLGREYGIENALEDPQRRTGTDWEGCLGRIVLGLVEDGPLLQIATAAGLGTTLGRADEESREKWYEFGREFGKAVVLYSVTVESPLLETTQRDMNGSV